MRRISKGEVKVVHTDKNVIEGGHAEVNALNPAVAEREQLTGHKVTREEFETFELHNVWLSNEKRRFTEPKAQISEQGHVRPPFEPDVSTSKTAAEGAAQILYDKIADSIEEGQQELARDELNAMQQDIEDLRHKGFYVVVVANFREPRYEIIGPVSGQSRKFLFHSLQYARTLREAYHPQPSL